MKVNHDRIDVVLCNFAYLLEIYDKLIWPIRLPQFADISKGQGMTLLTIKWTSKGKSALIIIIIQMDLQFAKDKGPQKTRVKVAIRVRPFIEKEKSENSCLEFKADNQIIIGADRSFKFDRVFREDSAQVSVYEQCIRELVLNCFEGYNAAVLAYGQTGSGKTFTMGTATSNFIDQSSIGIIPRTIQEIFREIEQRRNKSIVEVRASFIQIYNEQIIDLLVDSPIKSQNPVAIREEKDGSVTITGVVEDPVMNAYQMSKLLENGAKNRTTASTLMNDASSRSHAIFTIFIKQTVYEEKGDAKGKVDESSITAKFFFVDLAGSQRAKKTGATGAVLRQGISINLGLLQLGNVISALSTIDKNKEQFITFRNSKLTRILQDCLGGNSNTYMIACVSPAQSNYEESLNTLKYASKAMNIKNTPIINRDEKTLLRQKVADLEQENRRLRLMLSEKGVKIEELGELSGPTMNTDEAKKLREELKVLSKRLNEVNNELQTKNHKLNQFEIKMYEVKRDKDILQLNFEELLKEHPHLCQTDGFSSLRERFEEGEKDKVSVLEKYMVQVQSLEQKLTDRDNLFDQLQIQYNNLLDFSKKDEKILIRKNNLLHQFGKENQKLRLQLARMIQLAKQAQTVQNAISIQDIAFQAPEEEELVMLEHAEIIEQDKIILQHQENFCQRELQTKNEIDQVDQYILERESFLEKISKDQIRLETELISTMKNQYHQKIASLERQKKNLMKQKDDGSGSEKNRFATKIEFLEGELKDYRKRVKDQKQMEKLVDNQNNKIRDLAEEIKKCKVQKVELNRKLKEDKDNFDKLKSKRIKELLVAKKENLKKDNQIRKLALDNFKSKQMFKRKEEEIKKIKRVNETLKNIIKPAAKVTPKTSIHNGRINLTQSVQFNNYLSNQKDQKILDKEQQEALNSMLKQMIIEIDRENSLSKYQKKLGECEQELELLLNDDAHFRLKLQRINLKEEEEITEEDVVCRQELEMNLNDLKERIGTCEDSLSYCKNMYSTIMSDQLEYFDVEAQVIYNRIYQNIQSLKSLIKAAFNSLKNLMFENFHHNQQKEDRELELVHLKGQIKDLREQNMNLNAEYCRSLAQTREEMLLNKYYNDGQETTANVGAKRGEERQKRQLEKKIQELSKNNRQISSELQKTRRKCEVVQQKYQSIKNLVSKDKNIGTQQLPNFIKQDRKSANEKPSNRAMMEELDGMLDNIDKLKKVKSYTSFEETPQRQREQMKEDRLVESETNNKWECNTKIEAHNSSVLSLALHQSLLISTATKNIRIWDLETRKMISDLTGPMLSSTVKFVMIDPSRRLFFTACEKTVTLWDLVTLQVQGTLKCHKDEVRTIHCCGDYLFTGGKGSANSGSLLAWDLRKLNPNVALEQKQKNQDIFTFASSQNILYYGTRNHSIRRMNTNNFEILSPFEPPHLDAVTGLAIVKNKLISGSKDKHLRLWSLDHTINNSKHTMHIFNDYVNAVHSPPNHSLVYAGSKDGQVKVCYTRNEKLEVLGSVLTHTQSVNALCTLDENPYGLITASQDKTIKLWQPTKETLENISRQNYF